MEYPVLERLYEDDALSEIDDDLRFPIPTIRSQEASRTAFKHEESVLSGGILYRLMAKNFPNGMILLYDHELRYVLADGRGLKALGLSKETLEGRTLFEKFPPQICRQLEPAYRAALAGKSSVLEVSFPIEISPEETTDYLYQVQIQPVIDDQGGIVAGMVVAQDVTAQRQAEGMIRWQAYHDPLTGLPNRALLRDRLDQVLAMSERSGNLAALLFLDLDHFKNVNDTLGHAVGDRLLEMVAARLTSSLRAEDTVARIGGDEFVVLLPGLQEAQDAAKVAETLIDLLEAPIVIDEHQVCVSASVGISIFPRDGHNSAALMRHADAAMYQSKEERHARDWHSEKANTGESSQNAVLRME